MIGMFCESTLPVQLFVYKCDSDWYGITEWSKTPLIRDEAYSSAIVLNNLEVPYFWDVTNIVMDWVSGASPNYGIIISHKKTSGISSYKCFYGLDPIKRPFL